MNYRDCIKDAQKRLETADIYSQNAVFLMLELAQKEEYDLYLHYEDEVDKALLEVYEEKLQRLLNHEPLQYILGYENFYGYQFKVNEDVLIPRDETQELVANVLADIDAYFKNPTIVDVGTGSGAIAITLKKEEPSITMYATDISDAALAVAKENALNNEADVTFLQGDMLQPLIQAHLMFDILISNPPYIQKDADLEDSVKAYEPHVALFGGEDGLFFYRQILEHAHKILKPRSMLGFEIGYDQKDSILALAHQYFPNSRKEIVKDINGKDRMLFIYNNINNETT